MRLFLDTSVLLAASGSAAGASREIFHRASVNGWVLIATPSNKFAASCGQRLLAVGMLQHSRSHCPHTYSFCLTTSSTHENVFIMVGKPSVVVPNKTK